MNAEQLRHILRAAARVTGETEFVVIGSQAILGSHPDAPRGLRKSVEGDTYPKRHPEKAIDVDGAIGELSPFNQEFGYYAHGVHPETATLELGPLWHPSGGGPRIASPKASLPRLCFGLRCLAMVPYPRRMA
jgi:hypothetical protein